MWRYVVLLVVAVGLAVPALAAKPSTEFDGLWRGKLNLNCGVHGKLEVRIENGELSGSARVRG